MAVLLTVAAAIEYVLNAAINHNRHDEIFSFPDEIPAEWNAVFNNTDRKPFLTAPVKTIYRLLHAIRHRPALVDEVMQTYGLAITYETVNAALEFGENQRQNGRVFDMRLAQPAFIKFLKDDEARQRTASGCQIGTGRSLKKRETHAFTEWTLAWTVAAIGNPAYYVLAADLTQTPHKILTDENIELRGQVADLRERAEGFDELNERFRNLQVDYAVIQDQSTHHRNALVAERTRNAQLVAQIAQKDTEIARLRSALRATTEACINNTTPLPAADTTPEHGGNHE